MNNDKPKDLVCVDCKKALEPVYLPEISDIPARWLSRTICDGCAEKREIEIKRKSRQEEIRSRFGSSMLTPRFMERTFKNFSVNEKNRRAYELASSFEISSDGKGLLLYGPFGIGKTHLAAAIAHKLLENIDVFYISCPELLSESRPNRESKGKSNKLDMAKTVSLLILDDIGAEKPSDWVQETLFVLINYRYEYKLPTVFTTNCSMDQLEERLGGRIVSRIFEMCRCLKYEDKDFRMQKNLKVVNG